LIHKVKVLPHPDRPGKFIAKPKYKKFNPNTQFANYNRVIEKCIDFGFTMTKSKSHPDNTFGDSSYIRDNVEKFINATQGKLCEIAFYNFCLENNLKCNKPDFEDYGKGKWEHCDFLVTSPNGKQFNVSVKSCKEFASLLLLEKNRYTREGLYKENSNDINGEPILHDFIFLCRASCFDDIKKYIKKNSVKTYEDIKAVFKNYKIKVEVSGFITNRTFKYVISKEDEFLIKKDTWLGRPMDVNNYYVSALDLKPPSEFQNFLN